MSAATQPIDTPFRTGEVISLPVEASTTIYTGTMVAVNASGNAVPAEDTASIQVIGRADADGLNASGSAGDISIPVRRGVFKFNISTAHPVTQADVGGVVVVEDDNTVASTSTHSITAGVLLEVTSDGFAWVDCRIYAETIATPADGSVTTAKIGDGAVTTAKITAKNVTTATINDGAVTTTQLGAAAVTGAKLDSSALTLFAFTGADASGGNQVVTGVTGMVATQRIAFIFNATDSAVLNPAQFTPGAAQITILEAAGNLASKKIICAVLPASA